MSSASFIKAKYSPTLFDRLASCTRRDPEEQQPLRLMTAEELKESVARDVEALLNSRSGHGPEAFESFPQVARSICSYGMNDFVGLSLANPADRNAICRSLEHSISIHERRLKNVRVSLELETGAVNRLRFAIHAILSVHSSMEPVFFDALLQPSTLQYSVCKGGRTRFT